MLRLSSPEKKQQTMKELTEQFDIDEIRVFEPSLNDIFITYTNDSADLLEKN